MKVQSFKETKNFVTLFYKIFVGWTVIDLLDLCFSHGIIDIYSLTRVPAQSLRRDSLRRDQSSYMATVKKYIIVIIFLRQKQFLDKIVIFKILFSNILASNRKLVS